MPPASPLHEWQALQPPLSTAAAICFFTPFFSISTVMGTATAIACYEARRTAWTAGDTTPPT